MGLRWVSNARPNLHLFHHFKCATPLEVRSLSYVEYSVTYQALANVGFRPSI
ncbi:MAG: hypothetical protein AB1589_15660 [Cyanobacteriota bacterium]